MCSSLSVRLHRGHQYFSTIGLNKYLVLVFSAELIESQSCCRQWQLYDLRHTTFTRENQKLRLVQYFTIVQYKIKNAIIFLKSQNISLFLFDNFLVSCFWSPVTRNKITHHFYILELVLNFFIFYFSLKKHLQQVRIGLFNE